MYLGPVALIKLYWLTGRKTPSYFLPEASRSVISVLVDWA